jgi:hypothetical protein
MRKKIILPSIYSNQALCQLEVERPWILKSWLGTLSYSDDHGRFSWDPWRMALLIYPGNAERQKRFEEDLELLAKAGLILRYGPGNEFGCFPKFSDHNSMTRPRDSEYPAPPGISDKPKPEVEVEGNTVLNAGLHRINTGLIPPKPPSDSPVQPTTPEPAPSGQRCACGNATVGTCKYCDKTPAKSATPAASQTLGWDPHELNEPIAGYTDVQVRQIVRYHWDESDNPFWRDKCRNKEFFIRNIKKMAESVPYAWLNPGKVGKKKSFMHGNW